MSPRQAPNEEVGSGRERRHGTSKEGEEKLALLNGRGNSNNCYYDN
jgi:hypothetical protein